MSTSKTKEDIIKNKKAAIKVLNNLLEKYINNPSGEYLKKADLISYWIKEYSQMLDFEDKFNPKKNMVLKRGSIIKLKFGFNIGNEYGGLHYAVVLDKKDHPVSPTLVVVPLTSQKKDKKLHNNDVDLGDEIYTNVKAKYETLKLSMMDELESLANSTIIVDEMTEATKKKNEKLLRLNTMTDEKQNEIREEINKSQELIDNINNRKESLIKKLDLLDKMMKEIKSMKHGSIALMSQITTVSKIRVVDPKTKDYVLANINLSTSNMEKINQKLKELFIF